MKTSTRFPSRRRSLGAVALLGISFGASVVLAGCSGGDQPPSNLGNTGDDPRLDPPATPMATLEDFNGHWIGEAEDPLAFTLDGEPGVYRFPSGSSTIRLDLVQGEQGTLSFGDTTPPPPPSNFDVGYPEGVDYMTYALFEATVLPPTEGFVYEVLALDGPFSLPVDSLIEDVPLDDGVLRLSYHQNEVFREWCAGQVPSGPPGTRDNAVCMPPIEDTIGFDETHCEIGDGSSMADCNQLYLCGNSQVAICMCSGDRCFSNDATRPGLNLRRVGDELVGVFANAAFYAESGKLTSVGTVRFRRAQ